MAVESNQSGNRLFVLIAVALIGLICIGLMGLGVTLWLLQEGRAQEVAAQATNTPTPFPPTFTPTATTTPTATETPEPTPTGTPVVMTPAAEEVGGAVSEETLVTTTAVATQSIEAGAATETAIAAAGQVSPSATPETVPGSGGVLVGDSEDILLLVGSILLAILTLSGVIYWRNSGVNVAK